MTNIQAINLLKGLEQSLDDYCELNDEGKAAFRMAITALESFGISEQLPSAQPEQKKGRWLTSDNIYETGVCSVCKCDSQEPISYTITMFKYCPNCGADMRGEQE